MKPVHSRLCSLALTASLALSLFNINLALAATLGPMVDSFSSQSQNNLGIERLYITDTTAGGQTRVEHKVQAGILSVKGEILPPRGQPGWASTVLLLNPQGMPQNASQYQGIRILVRINKGNMSITANSSEITNFDFHAAPVVSKKDGEFHEVKIPFASMKRGWSATTPLNTQTITGISLVAFDVQKGSFDFEVDEVGFY